MANKPTLFVSIASYKDPEVLFTVKDLFNKSTGVFDIKVCVFSQIELTDTYWDELDSIDNVLHVKVDYRTARGVGWARAQAQSYYTDEDYYMQVDSHILFEEGWDKILLEDYNNGISYGRKAIVTAYPPAYEFNDDNERFIPNKKATKFDMNVANGIPSAAAAFKDDDDFPEQEFFIAGGFLFTSGSWVKEVPYDEEIFFLGEEITLAIRSYTAGYFIFSPTRFVCAHLYQIAQKQGEKRPNFWDKSEERTRTVLWHQRNKTSLLKAQHICRGEWFGKYGIQDLELYMEFYGRLKAYNPLIDLQKVLVT